MKLRMIFLDLDDTILDDKAASRDAFAFLISIHGLPGRFSSNAQALGEWQKISRRHWNRHIQKDITFQEQRRERIREFFQADYSAEEADRTFDNYRSAYESSWKPTEESIRFLQSMTLFSKALITNGDHEQQLRKVSATGISQHFIQVITPSVTGYPKPDQEMFTRALKLCGVEAEECCMIGDDEELDVKPAIAAGMHGFHLREGKDWNHIEEEIRNLT